MKILFIPINDLQVRRFAPIAAKLRPGAKVLAIDLGRYLNMGASEALRKAGIPSKAVGEYAARNPKAIILAEKPSVVVIGNDTDVIQHSFVVEAGKLGIPTVLVQDGMVAKGRIAKRPLDFGDVVHVMRIYKPRYIAKRALNKLARRVTKERAASVDDYGKFAKFVAVWGQASKRVLISKGVPAKSLVITGNPAIDAITGYRADRQILCSVGADPKRRTVLLATSEMVNARIWTKEELETMVKAVCVAVSSLPGAQLLIRPYPREDESVFRRLAAEYGNVFVDNRKIPLYDALGVADAVLTEISSVATEAVAMSKPLGIVNFTGRPFPTEPYPRVHIESGVALAITRESDLLPALKNLLYGSLTRQQLSRSRATFVRDQLYRMDGKSAERVARLIERAGRRK